MSTISALTFADHLLPRSGSHHLARNIALVLGGSLLIALCARISIPVGFGLVPITAQTFAVLLVGALLGARLGALAVIAYIGEGLAGLPVGAMGVSGIAWVTGPTGGYLVGFVVAAYITGGLAQRGWDRHPGLTIVAMSLGTTTIFAFGIAWLSRFPNPAGLLESGLYPFLPGAVIKIALATALLPAGWKVLAMLGDRK